MNNSLDKAQDKLLNKKVLFIAPVFHQYEVIISKELKRQGLIVTAVYFSGYKSLFTNKKARLNYWEKLRGRVVDIILKDKFDYLFVINLRLIRKNILTVFKNINPDAITIIYLWDSIFSIQSAFFVELLREFDYRYSFDYNDCITYPDLELKHRPTFYHPYISEMKQPLKVKYALASVMSIQPHRIKFINELNRLYKDLPVYFHIHLSYLLSFPSYFINHSLLIKPKYIKREKLTINQTLRVLNDSECILDISPLNQLGLTLRSLDSLGLNKKLITTNPDILRYDFYNSANILVIPPGKIEDIESFLKTPAIAVPSKIKDKYTVEFWARSILEYREEVYIK